jgi:hypothetical protein
VGAWPWRRADRPEDRRTSGGPPARHPPATDGPAGSAEPPRIRLGVDVLPVPGRAPRRAADRARGTARSDGTEPSAGPDEELDDAGGAEVDPRVRRVLAMAELSLLVLDED